MYLGNQPALNYTSLATQTFTAVTGQTQYSLDHSVANGNDILLYIANVKQVEGNSNSYTATGNTLTLNTTISAGTEMYCLFVSKAIQTVNPPNASVGASQIVDASITSGKLFSGFANGITEADQWRLNADLQGDQNPIASNLERVDTDGFSVLGTGMTHSSGIFTFPSTGYWDIKAHFQFTSNGTDNQKAGYIETTTDNSSYSGASHCVANFYANGTLASVNTNFLFDCTNTSTHKVRFVVGSTGGTGNVLGSDTNMNFTFFTFIKLGDT
jgi:hypothetical protein